MSRSCRWLDVCRRCVHLPDTSHTALAHGATAQRAHPERASSVESLTLSAIAEVVRTVEAFGAQRTRVRRASRARAASSFSCSLRGGSRSQPMSSEAHRLVEGVLDGLRATGFISTQRPVAKRWSANLTKAPTCTAEEPIMTSRHQPQIA